MPRESKRQREARLAARRERDRARREAARREAARLAREEERRRERRRERDRARRETARREAEAAERRKQQKRERDRLRRLERKAELAAEAERALRRAEKLREKRERDKIRKREDRAAKRRMRAKLEDFYEKRERERVRGRKQKQRLAPEYPFPVIAPADALLRDGYFGSSHVSRSDPGSLREVFQEAVTAHARKGPLDVSRDVTFNEVDVVIHTSGRITQTNVALELGASLAKFRRYIDVVIIKDPVTGNDSIRLSRRMDGSYEKTDERLARLREAALIAWESLDPYFDDVYWEVEWDTDEELY